MSEKDGEKDSGIPPRLSKPEQEMVESTRTKLEVAAFQGVLTNHVIGKLESMPLLNEQGDEVGFVDYDGKEIKDDIKSLLKVFAILLKVSPEYEISPDTTEKLTASADLMDKKILEDVKKVLSKIMERLEELKKKIVDIDGNPDYLTSFTRTGEMNRDILSVLEDMNEAREVVHGLHDEEGWPRLNGVDFTELVGKLDEVCLSEDGISGIEQEFPNSLQLNETLRREIIQETEENGSSVKNAKKMTLLMSAQLEILYNALSGQNYILFRNTDLDPGETDAESEFVCLKVLRYCMNALEDIKRTQQVIPQLA